MQSIPVKTAEEYMARFDVLRIFKPAYTFEIPVEVVPDGKIQALEMSTTVQTDALRNLSEAEFGKVWSQMEPGAQRRYFMIRYPGLQKFTNTSYQGAKLKLSFNRSTLDSESERKELLDLITDKRDLQYFVKATGWVNTVQPYDFFKSRDKKVEADLMAQARRRINAARSSSGTPQLRVPDGARAVPSRK